MVYQQITANRIPITIIALLLLYLIASVTVSLSLSTVSFLQDKASHFEKLFFHFNLFYPRVKNHGPSYTGTTVILTRTERKGISNRHKFHKNFLVNSKIVQTLMQQFLQYYTNTYQRKYSSILLTRLPNIWLIAALSFKVHSATTFALISFMYSMNAFKGFFIWGFFLSVKHHRRV